MSPAPPRRQRGKQQQCNNGEDAKEKLPMLSVLHVLSESLNVRKSSAACWGY